MYWVVSGSVKLDYEYTCPECGNENVMRRPARAEAKAEQIKHIAGDIPVVGDYTVCPACISVLRCGEAGKWHKVTDDDWVAMDLDERRTLQRLQDVMKSRKGAGGESTMNPTRNREKAEALAVSLVTAQAVITDDDYTDAPMDLLVECIDRMTGIFGKLSADTKAVKEGDKIIFLTAATLAVTLAECEFNMEAARTAITDLRARAIKEAEELGIYIKEVRGEEQ